MPIHIKLSHSDIITNGIWVTPFFFFILLLKTDIDSLKVFPFPKVLYKLFCIKFFSHNIFLPITCHFSCFWIPFHNNIMMLILCRRCYILCLIICLKVNGVITYHLNPIAIIIIIIRPFVINCIYIHFTIYSTVNMAITASHKRNKAK